ncbi:MAG TPA: NADH-quinone oxidoreductase subunit A, partial [Syntrophorhabdus sp.]|nr:NADH-quinone oxidoreductase subunit A [Syntrophorhabdus sp.]
PFGSAWVRYSSHYYIYALIFIAFDVDILYLFPAALSYTRGAKSYEFWSLLVFMLILGLAILYAWGKGVFAWKRKVQ